MIGHHPAVCQIDVILELNGNHLLVHLYDRPNQPIADATAIVFMIAQHFDMIANAIDLFSIRRGSEMKS